MSLRTVIALSACGFLAIGSVVKADPLRLGDPELDTVTAGQLTLEQLFSGGLTDGGLPPGFNLGNLLGLLPGLPGGDGGGGGGGGTPPVTTPPVDEGISTIRPDRPSSLDRSISRNRASLDATPGIATASAEAPPVFAQLALAFASPEIVAFLRESGQTGTQGFDQLFVVLQGDGVFASAGVSASSSS